MRTLEVDDEGWEILKKADARGIPLNASLTEAPR
jgi:hypothetical protein